MANNDNKSTFITLLGWVSIAADVLTLWQFIAGSIWLQFWSDRWMISLVFIILLMWAGLGLLRLGGSDDTADTIRGIFGLGYLVVAGILYVVVAWTYVMQNAAYIGDEIWGFAVLFLIAQFFGMMSLSVVNTKFFRIPAYFYGAASVGLAFGLVVKYVFNGVPFYWEFFWVEAVVLIVGATTFISFYNKSRGYSWVDEMNNK